MTIEQEKKCEELYSKYKELTEKTKIQVRTYVSGKSIESQTINPDEILKKEEVRKKLLEQCKNYLESKLTSDELFEIENG